MFTESYSQITISPIKMTKLTEMAQESWSQLFHIFSE